MNIFLVGGAVRDHLLNYPVIDKDWVVVGANAEKMLELGYSPVGSDFPVFLHPKTKEEYALARTERKSGKGYKGFSFYAAEDVTLEQDLSRRDLTINAMAQADNGQIIDPFNGKRDLTDKILRHVSDAFSEDPLRVLRVARFNARYAHLGFKVADETLCLMRHISDSGELDHLTRERVWQELEKSLTEQSPLVFFKVLARVHALDKLLTQLTPLIEQLNKLSPEQEQYFHTNLKKLKSAQQRLAWLFYSAQEPSSKEQRAQACQDFCASLRSPNSAKELIRNTLSAVPILQNWTTTSGHEKLAFICQAGLIKTVDKAQKIAAVVEALDINNKYNVAVQADKLERLLTTLRCIDHKALIKQGFKGGDLGKEIKRIQLEHCQQS